MTANNLLVLKDIIITNYVDISVRLGIFWVIKNWEFSFNRLDCILGNVISRREIV